MLISVNWSDNLKVYSSKDFSEIKSAKGVCEEINDDICYINFSQHLCVIATGSTRGVVMLWDIELLKLVAVN